METTFARMMQVLRRLALTAVLMLGLSPAFAAVPPPVPALPDAPRLTSYTIATSNCACNVNFALYGMTSSANYWEWIEVWINGVLVNYNDPTYGWTVTSPTGPLATIPQPITDAVLTFTNPQTGTIQIVGAQVPARLTQFSENAGVSARNLNVAFTSIIAGMREIWDKINDVTGRALISQPGVTLGPLPAPAACENLYLAFDGTGANPVCTPGTGITPSLPAGDIYVGNASNAPVGVPMSGDCGITSAGVVTCTKTNGVPLTALATTAPGAGVAAALGAAVNASGGIPSPTPAAAGDLIYWNGSAWTKLAGNASGTQVLSENASGAPAWSAAGSGTVTSVGSGAGLTGGPITGSGSLAVSLTELTNSLGGNVALNSSTYTDGPSVAQGTTGTWHAYGTVTVMDTSGAAQMSCKLWDGTTVIASTKQSTVTASANSSVPLSGDLTTPAGNIKISCLSNVGATSSMQFNASGNSKDSTLSVFRIK